jgi:hypothetical protein
MAGSSRADPIWRMPLCRMTTYYNRSGRLSRKPPFREAGPVSGRMGSGSGISIINPYFQPILFIIFEYPPARIKTGMENGAFFICGVTSSSVFFRDFRLLFQV